MSYNRINALLFIALLIFAASNQLADAQPGTALVLGLGGRVCCTPTGTCPGQGVAGVRVSLNCTIRGVRTTVGVATTNNNGTFTINATVAELIPTTCVAIIQLPLDEVACTALSTASGALVSLIDLVGITLQPLEDVLAATLSLAGFIRVGV